MHEQTNWNFLGLLAIVLQAVSVYMIAALVLPDPKADTIVDLREHYFAHRHWFFGVLLASVIFSLAKELVLYGRLPSPLDRSFQFAFGLIAIGAIIVQLQTRLIRSSHLSAPSFSFFISRCSFIAWMREPHSFPRT